MGTVRVTVDRNIRQPGSPLRAPDRSPGSPRRYLSMVHLLTPLDHDGLEPLDHIELPVLSWDQQVYSTKTLACVTV